ncbi:MAG TPA: branched-chain-amino-acid transaminase [Deltaproteobacteria bacterium]|nr:branched-chain-amino-acid transaminase [Deltaproteobacteria bacterium]
MGDRSIWFKGRMVETKDAKVAALSPTAQFGLNVFEGIRAYWNDSLRQLYAFRLKEHFDRLARSSKLLGIECRYGADDMRKNIIDTVRYNEYKEDIAIRMTVFIDGEGSWTSTDPSDMFIAPIRKPRTDTNRVKGLTSCVSTWRRIGDNNLPPRVKAGANYINGRYAHLEAKRNGYDLPILLNAEGKVAEGAGSCLFLVCNGVLTTPTLTSSVLESITRATLLEIAEKMGIKTAVREIDRTELYMAEELFLCGTAAEVTPIVSVDRLIVGNGGTGPITMSLLKRYLAIASNEDSSRPDWLTALY